MKRIIWKIYLAIPFKKQVYLILRRIYIPRKNISQYLQFVDNMNIQVDSQRQFKMRNYGYQLETEIFWYGIFGGWEKVSMQLWYELCQESETVFDIGANNGVYSLLAKTINPHARIYAFEPIERIYNKLTYNNHLNKYNIECFNKAVSNFDGSAVIYDKDKEHLYSVTVTKITASILKAQFR